VFSAHRLQSFADCIRGARSPFWLPRSPLPIDIHAGDRAGHRSPTCGASIHLRHIEQYLNADSPAETPTSDYSSSKEDE
jgi:hypothetical protein